MFMISTVLIELVWQILVLQVLEYDLCEPIKIKTI